MLFQPSINPGMPQMRDYSHDCHHFHWSVSFCFFSPPSLLKCSHSLKVIYKFDGRALSFMNPSSVPINTSWAQIGVTLKSLSIKHPEILLHQRPFLRVRADRLDGWRVKSQAQTIPIVGRANLWCKLSSLNHIIVSQQLEKKTTLNLPVNVTQTTIWCSCVAAKIGASKPSRKRTCLFNSSLTYRHVFWETVLKCSKDK